jgi:VanZ family protein
MFSTAQQIGGKPLAGFIRYWLPAIIWMLLIFSFSSDAQSYRHSSIYFEPLLRWLFPGMSQQTIEMLHHGFRKCCHATEYAILACLIWRAIRKPVKCDPRPWRWPEAGLALAVVFAYAAGDELHQAFVPARTAEVSDVLLDTCGGAIALLLLWLRQRIFRIRAA